MSTAILNTPKEIDAYITANVICNQRFELLFFYDTPTAWYAGFFQEGEDWLHGIKCYSSRTVMMAQDALAHMVARMKGRDAAAEFLTSSTNITMDEHYRDHMRAKIKNHLKLLSRTLKAMEEGPRQTAYLSGTKASLLFAQNMERDYQEKFGISPRQKGLLIESAARVVAPVKTLEFAPG